MTREQQQYFKSILEDAQAAAVGELLRDRPKIVIEQSADELEAISDTAARDVAIESLVRYSARLRHIRNAISRIGQNEFGTCLGCGDEISLKRLAAVPWTSLCIRCQQTADREAAGSSAGEVPGRAA